MRIRGTASAVILVLAACGSQASPSTAPASSSAPVATSAPASASAKPAVSGAANASAKPAGSAAAAAPAPASAVATSTGGAIVGTYPAIVTDELPTWLADDEGIFKKNGLNFSHQYVESSTGLAALLAGQSQFYEGGSEAASAFAQGADLDVFMVLSPVYPWVLEVSSDIKTATDLKGKKVGVSRFGSASDVGTRLAIKKLGLDPDKDVSIVQVGSESARIAGLQSGAIQAGVAQPPANFVVEAKGLHPILDLAQAKTPGALGLVATMRTYANAHRDVVQKFVDSVIQAIALEKKDEATATKVLAKYLKLDDQTLLDKAYKYYVGEVLPDYPYPVTDWIADTVTVVGKENPKMAQTDFSKMIDRSFVEDAQKRGQAGK
ncbi:MAG TPA: ABC transporter substrate-binding protein [Chloroflexota bacterium]